MSPQKSGEWRVGFTKFATRMLGELVEADFRVAVGDLVKSGDEIGSVEGFKAASDIFCGMEGCSREEIPSYWKMRASFAPHHT